ncbi:HNH endonuclease, partial [Mycolicibacterium mucogenicum]|uniref:HNH endonuclease n=1 Tax=Mycolicibacterium mucogenicum TaxID=56689 RepID=UPI0013A57655
MGISVADRKRLWGRSGSRCAMCFEPVIPESELGGAVLIGEEAHIVARELDGPRGTSPLTEEQRDEYANLILLCPTHHTLIDKKPTGPAEYPVDRLLQMKLDHERKVFTALEFDAKSQQREELWAKLIDGFVERIRWEAWTRLSSNLLNAGSQPSMLDEDFERLKALDAWILTRAWPEGHHKLRALIEGIGEVANQLILLFSRNAEQSPLPEAQRLEPRYSKLGRWDAPEYDRLLADYLFKRDLIADLVLELTRFSNAICVLAVVEDDDVGVIGVDDD